MLAESQERQWFGVALPGPPTFLPSSGATPGSVKSFFKRVVVVWSSCATIGGVGAGFTGTTSKPSIGVFPGTVFSQGGEGLLQRGRVPLFYQLSCEFVAAHPPGKRSDQNSILIIISFSLLPSPG